MSKGNRGGGAGGGGGGSQVGRETFGPSKATVKHTDFTKEETEAAIRREMGPGAKLQDVASAVGATDKSTVQITPMSDGLSVRVSGDGYQAHRVIYKDKDGKTVIENVFFETDKTGTGVGKRVFGRQVEQASRLGVSRIDTYAAGPGGGFNGYYTWPRFGYDAKIPSEVKQKLPARFSKAENISDLMRTKSGRNWWKKNGQGAKMKFDLAPDSKSRRVFDAYLKEKGTK